MKSISFEISELPALKKFFLGGERDYSDRVSFGLCMQLLHLRETRNEDGRVMFEMDALEGMGPGTTLRPAKQFRHPPLNRFFHKHVAMPRHLLTNVGIHWGLHKADSSHPEKAGNKWLDKMIRDVAREHGDNPERWPGQVAHRFTFTPLEWRGPKGLTGDWLIYGVHEGQNYYLGYSPHTVDDVGLFQMLKNLSAAEFPWFFGTEG